MKTQTIHGEHAAVSETCYYNVNDQSNGRYRSRTDEKDSNDASQWESYDKDIQKKIPDASRKRKRVNRG